MNPDARTASTAVVGLQWGDEGKGKVVDLLAESHDAIVRYNGGANAGHTVTVKGERYALHLIPSGILAKGKPAVVGNGVVVDPEQMLKEIDGLQKRGVDTSGLVVSDRAHVVMPYHKEEDAMRERVLSSVASGAANDRADRSIGTTKRGIGPAYAEKVQRAAAIRMGDLLREDVLREKVRLACAFKERVLGNDPAVPESAYRDVEGMVRQGLAWGERLKPHIQDTVYFLHDLLRENRRLLFEGANATLLDVDHGTYPYVTSSTTCALGIGAGAGVPPQRVGNIVGVLKAYTTRVGAGPFPTELLNDTGNRIRERGREYGTTTGRPRRCGWLDLVAVRYAAMLNGCTTLAVMLFDVLAGFDELKVCTRHRVDGRETDRFLPDGVSLQRAEPVYETLPGFSEEITGAESRASLPDSAKRYLDFIEQQVGLPIGLVSVGPDRAQTLLS